MKRKTKQELESEELEIFKKYARDHFGEIIKFPNFITPMWG